MADNDNDNDNDNEPAGKAGDVPPPRLKDVVRAWRGDAASEPAFLPAICQRITDDMLAEIANADYGMDYDAHLKALRKLRARDLFRGPLPWEPKEVLELFRWSEFGDDRTGQTPRTAAEFHLMRAFSCACLLEAYQNPANADRFDGCNQTVMQLLESVAHLGPDDMSRLADFWCAFIPSVPAFDDEQAFYGLALVWTMIRAGRSSGRDALFALAVLEACEAEFAQVRARWPESVNDEYADQWLLGWTFFDLRHVKWLEWAEAMSASGTDSGDEELRDRVAETARWLRVPGAWRDGPADRNGPVIG